jgi:uncharacterized protein
MEEPVSFLCKDKWLYGILHIPEDSILSRTVVTMVIGGSQTRVGGHRLYIQLARFLCNKGFAVFRFDYEGMGDSEGRLIGNKDAGPSIDAAINYLAKRLPEFSDSILWTICNGVSKCLTYAVDYPNRIAGLILCNPDVRSMTGDVRIYQKKQYYRKRLLDKNFWIKLFLLRVNIFSSFRILFKTERKGSYLKGKAQGYSAWKWRKTLPDRVIGRIKKCNKPIKIILSKEDFIANNFSDVVLLKKEIKHLIEKKKVTTHFIKGADHTFTEPIKKNELFEVTLHSVFEIGAHNR